MKNFPLLLILLLCCFTLHAFDPNLETSGDLLVQPTEINDILNKVFDSDENKFADQLKSVNKIIIIDENFNKIREVNIDTIDNLNNQSILVPIIYRSEFISKVYNVSYFSLKKNK